MFLQVTPEQLLQLLNPVAEVKYIRMTGRESDMVKTALVEFSEQPGLHRVFGLNGSLLNNRPIMCAYIAAHLTILLVHCVESFEFVAHCLQ